ncbi:MAG: hypothetical protein ACP5TL_00670 [Candidatus Micrarchaeia archaeon]
MEKKWLVFIVLLSVAFIFLAAAAALQSSGILTGLIKLLLLIIGIIFTFFAFASRFYLYMIVPLFQQHSRHLVLSNEGAYWLATTSDAILRKDGDEFVATTFISIPIYVSSTEMNPDEKLNFARQVGRLLSITNYPMRVTSQLYVMNKDSYIQQLREKISTVENEEAKLTQENAKSSEINKVHGELAMWKKMLDNISSETSLEFTIYASISAKGVKEFEAVNYVHQKASEIMSGIGATLGVVPSLVIGNDIFKFIEPEFLIPYSTVSEQITKNLQEQVV